MFFYYVENIIKIENNTIYIYNITYIIYIIYIIMNNTNNTNNINNISELFVDFGDELIIFDNNENNKNNKNNENNKIIADNQDREKYFDFNEINNDEKIRDKLTKFKFDNEICTNQILNFYHSTSKKNKVTFDNVIIDIKDLYKNKNLSENATIQVETNIIFDCEKTKSLLTDCKNKQLIYTPYNSLNIMHTHEHKVTLKNFFDYIKKFDSTIKYEIKNGNLLFNGEEDLIKVNNVLRQDITRRREARYKLSTYHSNQCYPVIDNVDCNHVFHQIYCYVPNIKIQNFNANLWKGLNELFLEAMYENAVFSASAYKMKNNFTNLSCYLIPLGEEYGIDHKQVARAIQRACHIASIKDIQLNVKLIHNNNTYDDAFSHISKSYPMGYVNVNSVWDTKF